MIDCQVALNYAALPASRPVLQDLRQCNRGCAMVPLLPLPDVTSLFALGGNSALLFRLSVPTMSRLQIRWGSRVLMSPIYFPYSLNFPIRRNLYGVYTHRQFA